MFETVVKLASRERAELKILPTDGARACWQISLDTRQLPLYLAHRTCYAGPLLVPTEVYYMSKMEAHQEVATVAVC